MRMSITIQYIFTICLAWLCIHMTASLSSFQRHRETSDTDSSLESSPTSVVSRNGGAPFTSSLPLAPAPKRSRATASTANPSIGERKEEKRSTGKSNIEDSPVSRTAERNAKTSACKGGRAKKNKDVYCICRKGNFGPMIACDDEECEFQWFHYKCVNISHPPKGKWFCPRCKPPRE